MENPLEHFELHELIPLALFGVDISINKAVVMMWITCAVVFGFFYAATHGRSLVSRRLQGLAEVAVEFLRGMVTENMGPAGQKLLPFVATLFFFVLFANLLGLFPGSHTVTSQLIVTGFLALVVSAVSVIVGFRMHGLHFFTILAPSGTPIWLLPLMIPIELISQLARPVTLAVRLFANMTAGHLVLIVLLSLALAAPLYIGWMPFGLAVAISLLEVFVAVLQAYIFTVLATVYLGDSIKLH